VLLVDVALTPDQALLSVPRAINRPIQNAAAIHKSNEIDRKLRGTNRARITKPDADG
jgi:hypothetical protein